MAPVKLKRESYLYDLEGNRTARFIDDNVNSLLDAGDDDIAEYEWDHRNRLTRVINRDIYGGVITQEVEHNYDAFNQWIKREVDPDGDTGSDPIEQTFFLYEQGQIVLEFDKSGGGNVAAGDLSHRYLWGPAVDMLLADEQVTSLGAAGETLWALTDHLGSVRDVVDDSGTLRIHRSFDSFGNVASKTHYNASGVIVTAGQTGYFTVDFAYTGKFFEARTGLQNNWHRWYDAGTGRWVSEDPLDFAAGDANKYRYVGNKVTSFVDWDGLQEREPRPISELPQFQLPEDFQGGTILIYTPVQIDPRVITELHRSFDMAIEEHGDPTKNCIRVGQVVTPLSVSELLDLGVLGQQRDGNPQNPVFGVVAIPVNRLRRGLGESGVNSFKYDPSKIRDAARDVSQPQHVGIATVFAHEIVVHLMGGIAFGVHPSRFGHIDSPYGQTGGTLSPGGCRILFDEFDIEFSLER